MASTRQRHLLVLLVFHVTGCIASWTPPRDALTLGQAYIELLDALSPAKLDALLADGNMTAKFARGTPFPHIVLDGLFPPAALELVMREHPEGTTRKGCAAAASKCFKEGRRRKHVDYVQHLKGVVDQEADMGPGLRLLFSMLKGSVFVNFLEQLSGVTGLLPDPHYRGSGLHLTAPGGLLQVHADFNRYVKYDLRRRVNTFVFLNKDWREEYGGHLELWDRNLTACHKRVLPVFGRFVAFASTDFSYHGHPQPLAAPAGRIRRSIALYYFSNGCPAEQCIGHDCAKSHSTVWQNVSCNGRCDAAHAICKLTPGKEAKRAGNGNGNANLRGNGKERNGNGKRRRSSY